MGPVEWLEQEYDTWQLIRCDSYDGLSTLRIKYAEGDLANRSYDQPMFTIKCDYRHSQDEEAQMSWGWCLQCEQGRPHLCSFCKSELPSHMYGSYCLGCWMSPRPPVPWPFLNASVTT